MWSDISSLAVSAADKFSLRLYWTLSRARTVLDGEEDARFVCLETVNSTEGEIEPSFSSDIGCSVTAGEQVPYL